MLYSQLDLIFEDKKMCKFQPKIPYNNSSLQPVLSAETLNYHYGKHHAGYASNLNSLIENTEFSEKSLEEIIILSRASDRQIFNNASQLFNHNFYWKCLKYSDKKPKDRLKNIIDIQFDSFDSFLEEYISFANKMFGSGWSWVIFEDGKISFLNTMNAENPIGSGKIPICVIDLWEHAYYIDYKNDRKSYITKLVKECINWEFCESLIPS